MFPLLAIGWWLFNQSVAKKKADASQLRLVPINLKGTLSTLQLQMQVINPTTSTFTVDSLNANIYYQNTVIGTISRPNPFTIKPTANSIIAFDIVPNVGNAVASIITAIADKKIPKTVTILGAYKYQGLSLPIDKTLTLNV